MLQSMLAIFPLLYVVNASVDYITPGTDHCTDFNTVGQTVSCGCTDACAAGGTIDDVNGLCSHYLDTCRDPPTAPKCNTNQIYSYYTSTWLDAGGTCAPGCKWHKAQYTYRCCNCPDGYISQRSNCLVDQLDFSCVGCTGAREVLLYDKTLGAYICTDVELDQTCDIKHALETLVAGLGNLNTWAGALCPATGWKAAAKLLAPLIPTFGAISNPTMGATGTEFTAASALISAFNSVALGAGLTVVGLTAAEATLAIGVVYSRVCAISGIAGLVLGGAKGALSAAQRGCPKQNSKRLISPLPAQLGYESLSYARRATPNNPCEEALSYLPTDYTNAVAADSGCDAIVAYDSSKIQDMTVAAGVADLQKFCNSYQASGNSTLMIDFQLFLSAVKDAIPYCGGSQNNSSTSSVSVSLISQNGPSSSSLTSFTTISVGLNTTSIFSQSQSLTSTSGMEQIGKSILSNPPVETSTSRSESKTDTASSNTPPTTSSLPSEGGTPSPSTFRTICLAIFIQLVPVMCTIY
ncbi:hypothetical protein H072_2853 [Dactylellina haptotyla CBS 200.50]|uniref:Uncharacterized protein n=1 Tax=Dactylellina haptotyla (strain CBS 200.50) TaxID=1284197 RepID=S8APP7_DACHA|nr:hypothetical protein H072_2853 [Dactylellina haptotyla CBS 200.50]